MKNSFKIIAASLLGAGLIHFTLTACSGGSSDRASSNPASSSMTTGGMTMGSMTMDPTKDAAASPVPTCAQWQLYLPRIAPSANKFFSAAGTIDEGSPDSPPGGVPYYSVPPGWEPFAADQNGFPIFRRCAM